MTVKNVLCEAAKLLGESDVVNYLSDKIPDDAAYCEETETALKHCYDVVIDEIACEYMPLIYNEKLSAKSGTIDYSDFSKTPVRIKKVCDENSNKLPYRSFIDHLAVNCDYASVTYEYKPETQNGSDEAYYSNGIIGVYVLSYGIAAEFCTERGRIADAEVWNGKFASAMRARVAEKGRLKIKNRNWC